MNGMDNVFVDEAGVELFLYNMTFITTDHKVHSKQVLAMTERGAKHEMSKQFDVMAFGKTTKNGGDPL